VAEVERQEVRAIAKWVRMSPRKARLVAEHIRGRTVPEARTVLAFTQRAAARELEKVLASAVANAEANHDLVGDDLVISAAYVDEGPVMKRWRPRARGRVNRIRKPTCHITIKLAPAAERDGAAARPARVQPAPEGQPRQEAMQQKPRVRKPPVVEEQVAEEEVVEEPVVEEPVVEEPQAEEPPAEEPQAEKKPKRRRRAKKTEETEEA
jgi:large subunit ribosomal protein L22